MTDEVKRIFSINLNRYINRSGKTQKEIVNYSAIELPEHLICGSFAP